MNAFSFRLLPLSVAPILFYLSLVIGYIINNDMNLGVFATQTDYALLVFFSALSIIPLGFIFSQITIFVLRIYFWVIRGFPMKRGPFLTSLLMDGDNFEAIVTDDAKKRILDSIGANKHSGAKEDNSNLYALAVYINEKFSKGLGEWFSRRDKVFITLCNCITALLLAYFIGRYYCRFQDNDSLWFWVTLFLVAVFYFNAYITRMQLIGLVNFASQLENKK